MRCFIFLSKPVLRGHFHQGMFFIALGAGLVVLTRCETFLQYLSFSIYLLCMLSMFGISTLYHRITWSVKHRLLWKKLDHAGIYLMIAGTFTPIALLGLSMESAKSCLLMIWIVAFVGIIQSIFFVNLPKFVSAILYLIAGYLILPYFSELKTSLGVINSSLIVAGGVVYSIGAISYGLKRPVFYPKYFGYHELFHIMVNIGAILHFIVINNLIQN